MFQQPNVMASFLAYGRALASLPAGSMPDVVVCGFGVAAITGGLAGGWVGRVAVRHLFFLPPSARRCACAGAG
ncbi:hypothetical protein WIA58_09455 [Serratia marcescens]|uniref:hypothetical protein n=1 Tax=Serratia marcescens TaxID=615 RepID=UPI00339D2352